jgi:hypothetical protein
LSALLRMRVAIVAALRETPSPHPSVTLRVPPDLPTRG